MQYTGALYNEIYKHAHTHEAKLAVYASNGLGNPIAVYSQDSLMSMETVRNMFGSGGMSVGNCVSGQINISLFPLASAVPFSSIPKMAQLRPFVRLVSLEDVEEEYRYSEWIPKGVFYIDTRETDKASGIMKIEGYDAMLKAESDFPTAHESHYPLWDDDVVIEIADAMGVEVDSRTWDVVLGDSGGYQINFPNGYSQREVLSGIAVPYGANWIISDEGKLLAIGMSALPVTSGYLVNNGDGLPITFGGVRILV